MDLQNREYQDRVVEKTIKFFEDKEKSVMIESPTGSGKSVMALRIIKHLEDKHGFKTSWVAMRRNLLKQVVDMNERWFGCKNITPVSMFEKTPPPCDLVVVDEVQHDATVSCTHIHSMCNPKMVLGLSATPYRSDKLKLAFNRVVRDAGIHRLIQDGYLSPYHHYNLDKYDPARVAEVYLSKMETWGKSVVFFHTIAHCQEFATYLAAAGQHCEVVTGESDRETQLDAFERGDFKVVANVAILTEGYDCPDLQTVFVRDSSKLPAIQMAGRGFRIHEGKTHCNIVQSKNTKWPFAKTAKCQRAFMLRDDEWYTMGSSEVVQKTAEVMADKVLQFEVQMPKWLLAKQEKKHRRRRRPGFGGTNERML